MRPGAGCVSISNEKKKHGNKAEERARIREKRERWDEEAEAEGSRRRKARGGTEGTQQGKKVAMV
jgi:hypothetical protein